MHLPRILGLFAKLPQPGYVKTRLSETATPEWAVEVASALLLDSMERLASISARRLLAYSPLESAPFFTEIARGRFTLTPQGEGDLGERLSYFFAEQFKTLTASVVVVGTDSPTLPLSYIDDAFNHLEHADVVLGPATDGGYYLIGCARFLPCLFEQIPWSTADVLRTTVDRVQAQQLRLALLPPWYDVDTLDDWRMLRGHVAAMRYAAIDPGVPRTEKLLMNANP